MRNNRFNEKLIMKKILFLIITLSCFINLSAQNDSTKLLITDYDYAVKYFDSIALEEEKFWDSIYTVAEQNPIFILAIEKNRRPILLKSTYDFYLEVDGYKKEPIWISKDSFQIPLFEDSIKFVLVYKNDVFKYQPDFLKRGGNLHFGIITNPQRLKKRLEKPYRSWQPFNQRDKHFYTDLIEQSSFITFFIEKDIDYFLLYRYQPTWSEMYTRCYDWRIKKSILRKTKP